MTSGCELIPVQPSRLDRDSWRSSHGDVILSSSASAPQGVVEWPERIVFPNPVVHAPPDDPRHDNPVDCPSWKAERMTGREEHLESFVLRAHQRPPAPRRRRVGPHRPAGELCSDVAGDQRISSVTSGAALGVGRGDVADGENAGVTGHPQIPCHPDETPFVEQLRR